jgi:hypothetical protein
MSSIWIYEWDVPIGNPNWMVIVPKQGCGAVGAIGKACPPTAQLIKAQVRGNISHFITGVTACLHA